jgi:hypothetical protein
MADAPKDGDKESRCVNACNDIERNALLVREYKGCAIHVKLVYVDATDVCCEDGQNEHCYDKEVKDGL